MTPTLLTADAYAAPSPVLFNCWKHHAGFLRRQIDEAVQFRRPLNQLTDQLVVVGSELMDLYDGPFSPREIADQLIARLRADHRFEPSAYDEWVKENKGYRLETIDDQSFWTLRSALDDTRYIHIHPGRHAPNTRRVRANVLKTAVLVLAETGQRGGSPFDLPRINRVRARYLRLENVYDLAASQSIRGMIELLKKSDRRANFPASSAS